MLINISKFSQEQQIRNIADYFFLSSDLNQPDTVSTVES